MKACHVTTVHGRYDTRIFLKECRSLARAGHDVTLQVADGLGDETRDGVRIVDAGKRPGGLAARFRFSATVMREAAAAVGADLYHLHDAELLPAGARLSRDGRIVVYDAHEDLPRQLRSKTYVHPLVAGPLSVLVESYEDRTAARFDAVVAATDSIARRFERVARRCSIVRNYPSLEELGLESMPARDRLPKACYVGGLRDIRGSFELAAASLLTDVPIEAAGRVEGADLDTLLRGPGSRIGLLGILDRAGVARLMTESSVGIVTYLPVPNHVEALPTKIFEYMAAGLPIVASDFPLWRDIVEGGGCGACVDPSDPKAIAAAIAAIVADPGVVARMGAAGRRLVEERYNWSVEEKTLLALYRELEAAS